jgi:hypothetical protein
VNHVGRPLIVALVCLMSFTAAAALGPVQAFAQTVTNPAVPQAPPIHCSGDVCAQVTALSGGNVSIKVWCNNFPFTGHFDLISPAGGLSHWPAVNDGSFSPGSGHTFTVPEQNGTYTANAWERIGPGRWSLIGSVRFSVTM